MANDGESQFQNVLQQEIEKFKLVQRDFLKLQQQRQQLDGLLNENTAVKQELDLLKAGAEVYKLIGPVLMKQDREVAKENVSKRMDYIRNELKRIDDTLIELDEKQDKQRETLAKLQEQYEKSKMKGS